MVFVVFFILLKQRTSSGVKCEIRQMGTLHPMKMLMAIKLSGSSNGPRIFLFSCTLQRSLCEDRNLQAVWFSRWKTGVQTSTEGYCFLTCLGDFYFFLRPDIWWHFLSVDTHGWVTVSSLQPNVLKTKEVTDFHENCPSIISRTSS